MSSGMFAAISILAALLAREKTGEGQYIDVSMMEGLLSWTSPHAALDVMEGDEEPGYGVFETRGGEYITLGVSRGEPFWEKMWGALGYEGPPEGGQGELRKLLAAKLKEEAAGHWLKVFQEAYVPCGPVHSPDETADDPQVVYRKALVELEHPEWGKYRHARFPALFSGTPTQIRSAPPLLGEHTDEILGALGYSTDVIEILRADGTI